MFPFLPSKRKIHKMEKMSFLVAANGAHTETDAKKCSEAVECPAQNRSGLWQRRTVIGCGIAGAVALTVTTAVLFSRSYSTSTTTTMTGVDTSNIVAANNFAATTFGNGISFTASASGNTATICINAPSVAAGQWVGFGVPDPAHPTAMDNCDAVILFPKSDGSVGIKRITQAPTGVFGTPGDQGDDEVKISSAAVPTMAGFNACFDRAISVTDGGQIAASGKGNAQQVTDAPSGSVVMRHSINTSGAQTYMWAYGSMSGSVPQIHSGKGFVSLALFADAPSTASSTTTTTITTSASAITTTTSTTTSSNAAYITTTTTTASIQSVSMQQASFSTGTAQATSPASSGNSVMTMATRIPTEAPVASYPAVETSSKKADSIASYPVATGNPPVKLGSALAKVVGTTGAVLAAVLAL
ncbi:hypothetical protein BC830DRAFT_1141799 [Chytriomyces sp. MP71]|nr:hypothetical protein BC830DRAFT_1141799 [Chytriomyces sp. MP71]